MSGTHALDQPTSYIDWHRVKERTADTFTHVGAGALQALNRFEVRMTSRSLRRDTLGTEALQRYAELGLDPRFAREVEARINN